MAYKIVMAKTTKLLDQVFKLRHQVFMEEEGLLKPTHDGRLMDRFDAYPTTKNLVVTYEDKVVGSFRLALDSSEGLPADEYYDFRKDVPQPARLMHTSYLCILKKYRSPRLTTGLALMAAYYGTLHDITHVVAPINPKISGLLQRIGYRPLGKQFTDPHTGAEMLPLLLDVRDLNDFFLNFIENNQLQDFLHSYERWFYQGGENIITAGTVGQEAYLIIEGSVRVSMAGSDQVLGELHEGDIFGELALLTEVPRSADVTAIGNVQVMVLSKEVFVARFLNNPEQALRLMRLMGKRTVSLIHQLEETDAHTSDKNKQAPDTDV